MSKSSTVTVRERPVEGVASAKVGGLTIHGETMVVQTDQRVQLDPGPGNARNSEASFVTLKNGRIVLAWSKFTSDNRTDFGAGVIAARHSDGWSTHVPGIGTGPERSGGPALGRCGRGKCGQSGGQKEKSMIGLVALNLIHAPRMPAALKIGLQPGADHADHQIVTKQVGG